MKIVVAHISPDWDAITSVWLIKKYLAGWQDAVVKFVPAGQRLQGSSKPATPGFDTVIEIINGDEVIHVDTGLGPLDHHQTQDTTVSAASRTWDYVRAELKKSGDTLTFQHEDAISRLVKIIVDTDHFKEVFWKEPAADYHEFSLLGLMEGLKYEKPNQDKFYLEFGIQCLNALVAEFENRIWAEKEIEEKGMKFETRFGPGIGFETLNDTVLKLSQKMGYVMVIRKDPRKGYVRIKTLPDQEGKKGADLTLVYEQLKKIDPQATWFLHVSKKMLLNGTPKNPKMIPTSLSLGDIIKVVAKI
ncbi:MAG TPA: hypothetical protein VE090_02355 [Methylomirabilota bacterium]|nr:hypothetical protein [Methylomirabilota bacterium]